MHSVLAYWKYRLVVLSRPFVTWVDQLAVAALSTATMA
jgi:predicted transcriptional regulator